MDSPQEKLGHFNFFFFFSVCRDNTPVTYCRSNVSTESYFMCRPAFFCIICLLFFFFQSVCIFVRTHTGRLQTRAKIRTVRTSWIRQALLSLAKIQTARNKGNKKKEEEEEKQQTIKMANRQSNPLCGRCASS